MPDKKSVDLTITLSQVKQENLVLYDALNRILKTAQTGRAQFGTVFLRLKKTTNPQREIVCSIEWFYQIDPVFLLGWYETDPMKFGRSKTDPVSSFKNIVLDIIPGNIGTNFKWEDVVVGYGSFNGLWRKSFSVDTIRKKFVLEGANIKSMLKLNLPTKNLQQEPSVPILSVDNLVLFHGKQWNTWDVLTPWGVKTFKKSAINSNPLIRRMSAKNILHVLTGGKVPDVQALSFIEKKDNFEKTEENMTFSRLRKNHSQLIDRELKKKGFRFTEKGHIVWESVREELFIKNQP